MTVENEIAILDQFMSLLDPEVSGRSDTGILTSELKEQLQKLAAGSLGADDRAALAAEIVSNEAALAYLVKKAQ